MKRSDTFASRWKKRGLLLLAGAALLLISIPVAISAFVCVSAEGRILSADEAIDLDADAILVLGARVEQRRAKRNPEGSSEHGRLSL